MDRIGELVRQENVRAQDLVSTGGRIYRNYENIFKEKNKLADSLKMNSDKQFLAKSQHYIIALMDDQNFKKFSVHMNTILLPAISTYEENAKRVQAQFRVLKPKVQPRKKGGDPTKLIEDFETKFKKHQEEQSALLKQILRHLVNAELFLHTSQIQPLMDAFTQLGTI